MRAVKWFNPVSAASVLLCVALPVTAAEWTSEASVTPGVTYTDNVCLSADNEQDQWIGLVTPAGSVTADGSHLDLSVNGSVELNTLTDSKLRDLGCTGGNFGNREQFAPSLDGTASAILVENWFYVDSTANISQNQVTPFASGGGDSLDRTGNTNTTYSYSVSPYITRRFKDTAEANLRYTWDEQFNSTDAVGDSSEESAQALINSVPGVSKYSWGLQGDYSRVSYSDSNFLGGGDVNNQDNELKSAQINQGYQLTRTWQVNGFYGQEWNDFVSTRDDIDGTFWDAGVRWTPNERTTVEAGSGDRFFGSTPRFSITHRHKRSALDASYRKDITYNRDIRTLDSAPPIDPGFPSPPDVNPGQTTLANSPLLDERFTLGYSYQGLRSTFGVSAFESDQTSLGEDLFTNFDESTYRGISVSFGRTLSQLLSLSVGLAWDEQEPRNSTGFGLTAKSETWTGNVGLQRQLSQRMNLGLNYQYTDRQSDNVGDFDGGFYDDYTENRITLDLTIAL